MFLRGEKKPLLGVGFPVHIAVEAVHVLVLTSGTHLSSGIMTAQTSKMEQYQKKCLVFIIQKKNDFCMQ